MELRWILMALVIATMVYLAYTTQTHKSTS